MTDIKSAGLLLGFGGFITVMALYHITTSWRHTKYAAAQMVHRDYPPLPLSPSDQRKERLRRANETCSTYDDKIRKRGGLFIVDRKLRVLYCIVGKVACTSWLRVLMRLTGNPRAASVSKENQNSRVHMNFRKYLRVVSTATAAQLSRSTTKDYYAFMFARDPMTRLISAYRDKMIRHYSYRGLRKKIISRYRRYPSPNVSRTIKPEDRVRFDEFVEYIVNGTIGLRGPFLDIHWEPVYEMCEPCHIKYDYIGHYETIHLDAERIIRQLARRSHRTVNTAVMFPATDSNSRNPISRESLLPYFENVSADNIIRLMRLYRKDYETFGYKIPDEFRRKIKSLKQNVTDLKIR